MARYPDAGAGPHALWQGFDLHLGVQSPDRAGPGAHHGPATVGGEVGGMGLARGRPRWEGVGPQQPGAGGLGRAELRHLRHGRLQQVEQASLLLWILEPGKGIGQARSRDHERDEVLVLMYSSACM